MIVVLGGMEACGERDWGCAKGCGGVRVARWRDVRRSWWGVSARRMSGVVDVWSGVVEAGAEDVFLGSSFVGAGGGGGEGWM